MGYGVVTKLQVKLHTLQEQYVGGEGLFYLEATLGLFAVMINKLLKNWHICTKYVDDTTAFEIIPRNPLVY